MARIKHLSSFQEKIKIDYNYSKSQSYFCSFELSNKHFRLFLFLG